jgi:hypothetical protein
LKIEYNDSITGRITADTHKTPSLNDRSENNNGKWVAKTRKTAGYLAEAKTRKVNL